MSVLEDKEAGKPPVQYPRKNLASTPAAVHAADASISVDSTAFPSALVVVIYRLSAGSGLGSTRVAAMLMIC